MKKITTSTFQGDNNKSFKQLVKSNWQKDEMNDFKKYLRWSDVGTVVLSALLVYWIYVSVGWAVTVLAILVCTNDVFALIVDRIRNERDNITLGIIGKLMGEQK